MTVAASFSKPLPLTLTLCPCRTSHRERGLPLAGGLKLVNTSGGRSATRPTKCQYIVEIRVLADGRARSGQIDTGELPNRLLLLRAMEKSRLEIKVGFFVLIGLVLLAVALVWFSKGTSIFRGTYQLKLHAVNVGGIKERAGVLLAGVQVGSVSKIKLADDGKSVTILLNIYKDYPIYHDARFVIEQAGFLGDQFVSVIPTTNSLPLLENGADVPCQEPFNLQEVARSTAGFVQRIDATAKKLDESVGTLQRVVLNENTLTNFAVAINNSRLFSEEALDTIHDINTLVATNGTQINQAVSNAVYFSEDLMRLAGNANTLLATNGAEITVAVSNVRASTEVLKKLMDDLQSGRGLAGTLLQNDELATNMQTIAANLSVTSSNLNRIGLWGVLWAHKATTTNPPALQAPRNKNN